MKTIMIKEKILARNEEIAAQNKKLLSKKGIFTINILGSPGAGKTSLLERIMEKFKNRINVAVIEGDLYTNRDAERLEKYSKQIVQINTEGACHLEAGMVKKALNEINLEQVDMLIIENVGNLVCTASYELGEDIKLIVLSVTEGCDKILKYPLIFQKSEILVLNKVDLLQHTDFSFDILRKDLKCINKQMKIYQLSCRTGKGIENLCHYLEGRLN